MTSKRPRIEQKQPATAGSLIRDVPAAILGSYVRYLSLTETLLLVRRVLVRPGNDVTERKLLSNIDGIDDTRDSLVPTAVLDAILPLLKRSLQRLTLSQRNLSNPTLAALTGLPALRQLYLNDCTADMNDFPTILNRLDDLTELTHFSMIIVDWESEDSDWFLSVHKQDLYRTIPSFLRHHREKLEKLRISVDLTHFNDDSWPESFWPKWKADLRAALVDGNSLTSLELALPLDSEMLALFADTCPGLTRLILESGDDAATWDEGALARLVANCVWHLHLTYLYRWES